MREFAKFGTGFWTSSTIQAMSDTGKLLAAYLITSPHSNQVGVFRMPTGYVQGDLGWSAERVTEGFDELSINSFATRCKATFWVVIHKALKHTPPENPNQIKHVRGLLDQVPLNASIRALIAQCLSDTWPGVPEDLITWLRKPLPNPLPTVAKQREVEVEVEVEREREKKERGTTSAGVTKRPHAAEPPTRSTWSAYSDAYQARYGVAPVRNRTVNGQLANFVGRIGADEAPQVAAFYVQSNRGLYVSAKHPVNLLVRDAEGVHTEWASGRSVTDTEARQADRTQSNLNVHQHLMDTFHPETDHEPE